MRLYKLCTYMILLLSCEAQLQLWATSTSTNSLYVVQPRGFTPRGNPATQNTKRINLWASGNYQSFKDDFFIIKAKGRTTSELVGGDYRISSILRLGLSYRHDDLKSTSVLNASKTKKAINNIAPYLYYNIKPWLYFNMAGGYGHSEIHTRYVANGVTITGKNSSNIWFATPSLLASYIYHNVIANLSLGYSYYTDKQKSYLDSRGTFVPASRWTVHTLQLVADLRYTIKINSTYLKGIVPGIQGGTDYLAKQTPLSGSTPAVIGRKFKRGKSGYIAAVHTQFLFANNIYLTVRANQYWGHSSLMVRGVSALLSCRI